MPNVTSHCHCSRTAVCSVILEIITDDKPPVCATYVHVQFKVDWLLTSLVTFGRRKHKMGGISLDISALRRTCFVDGIRYDLVPVPSDGKK